MGVDMIVCNNCKEVEHSDNIIECSDCGYLCVYCLDGNTINDGTIIRDETESIGSDDETEEDISHSEYGNGYITLNSNNEIIKNCFYCKVLSKRKGKIDMYCSEIINNSSKKYKIRNTELCELMKNILND